MNMHYIQLGLKKAVYHTNQHSTQRHIKTYPFRIIHYMKILHSVPRELCINTLFLQLNIV